MCKQELENLTREIAVRRIDFSVTTYFFFSLYPGTTFGFASESKFTLLLTFLFRSSPFGSSSESTLL